MKKTSILEIKSLSILSLSLLGTTKKNVV